ncbi:MAG: glycosyltransferase family 9 protein [Oligoflexia bacterium]|nr:glycosyltransferase family 9 protein [Oligoflexia bacterium]
MQTAFLGDVLLCIPLLKALRFYHPESKIALLCRKNLGEFFLLTGLVDTVIEVDKSSKSNLKLAFQKMKAFQPEVIISPHRSFRTALWAFRLKPKLSVGFLDLWSFFAYNRYVLRPEAKHDVLRQLSLLKGLRLSHTKLPAETLTLNVQVKENTKFEKYRNAVVIAPGSQWNTKQWTKEGYIEVAKMLVDEGHKIVLVGAPNEKKLCEEISIEIQESVNLCGTTSIYELAQVLKVSSLLICNDSGAMHVATTVGTPVVSIFGPTVQKQGFTPWSKKSKVIEAKLGCRPCGAHGHNQCPIGTHDCMKKIRPIRVHEAAVEFLA